MKKSELRELIKECMLEERSQPKTAEEAFGRVYHLVDLIFKSQGWKEGLRSSDPGNVTNWIGPPLNEIMDLARNFASSK
jgi:hypothetical protein